MTDRQMMDDFFAWLAEHNYCKVTPCIDCFHWGDKEKDKEYQSPMRHCRYHHILTWPDDSCNYAVEEKHEN